jgi:CRP-like cAMP-binding protein
VDIQRETEALSKVPLFSKLEQSKLKLLAFTSELQTYEDGETVFTEGEAADCTFVIMDGEADIYAKIKTDGGLGVLTSSPRSATIRAKGRLMTLRISGDMFLRLLAENPPVALDVMRQLSGKLVLAHRQAEELQDKLQQYGDA